MKLYIDNKDTRDLDIVLLRKKIGSATVESKDEWLDNSLDPIIRDKKHKWRFVECEFFVNKDNDNDAEKSISYFAMLTEECELIFDDIDFRFKVSLDSLEKEKVAKGKFVLNVTFKSKHPYTEKIINKINKSTVLLLQSTKVTPCNLIINPSSNLVSLSIKGFGEDITIKNLTQDKKITIDGDKGLVLEEGLNKWKDYDSWSFPRLFPGENKIILSDEVDISIEYNPRWK